MAASQQRQVGGATYGTDYYTVLNQRLNQHKLEMLQYHMNFYANSMAVADEFGDKLTQWSDSLKGKDKDPDNYMPWEHFEVIYKLRTVAPKLADILKELGNKLREEKDDGARRKMLDTFIGAFDYGSLRV